MKHTHCDQNIVALHKQRVSVVAWHSDLLKGALAGRSDMFAIVAVELVPFQLWVSPLTTRSSCCLR